MKILVIAGLLASITHGTVHADALSESFELAGDNAAELREFVESATEKHGSFGKQAAQFLVQGMPAQDLQSLKRDFLLENLTLAMQTRESFPWGKTVPDEVFLNDVLPYASLDETREPWRKGFLATAQKLVADCQTPTEAAQTLNKNLFNVIKVHYNTGRKRPNQSPAESIDLGMATCTGLSIILVDACRAVGVPARVVGTPLWSNKRGNHTWVEVWDSGQWHFTGADEFDPKGLDRGWFVADAAKAQAERWEHAIWATSWRKSSNHFPMVWDLSNKNVPAVNVTASYAAQQASTTDSTTVHFRVFEKPGGNRLVVAIDILDQAGKILGSVETKAGQADLNDMPMMTLPRNQEYQVKMRLGDQTRTAELKTESAPEMTLDWNWAELQHVSRIADADTKHSTNLQAVKTWLQLSSEKRAASFPAATLTRDEADAATQMIWQTLQTEQAAQRQQELKQRIVKAAGKEMKYLEKAFGDTQPGEKSLWISMHGGGGAPARVNDQQWQNQIRLYQPEEGIVVAPRAPTDNWNLWHEEHIDALFDRLIGNFVLQQGVSPDRIYLMGYSAGGDGVYQLAPRMADRFAAAAMMAGHPNDASPLGLRNLPFMIFMGGEDAAYKRNEVAAQWKVKLGDLKQADQNGYEHLVTIYEGLGHWMQGKDAAALPWMTAHTRSAWPKKIVWQQSNRTHERFYWLAVPKHLAKGGQVVRADAQQQHIDILVEGELNQLDLRLNDQLLDLDHPIEVTVNGKAAFSGQVQRSVEAIWNSLNQRMDVGSVAYGELTLQW